MNTEELIGAFQEKDLPVLWQLLEYAQSQPASGLLTQIIEWSSRRIMEIHLVG